jgi:murein DD-endopeptidase MepM/ murein hydrolase activator NlpD
MILDYSLKKIIVRILTLLILIILSISVFACNKPSPRYEPWMETQNASSEIKTDTSTPSLLVEISPTPEGLKSTPTPNVPANLPTLRAESLTYTIERGDTLAKIALVHQVSVSQILENNTIENPNLIDVGQVIIIPPASANALASNFKIIPDSELVYSPNCVDFDIASVISQGRGFLEDYTEEIEGNIFSGSEIVRRVAYEYSVCPRLLLGLIEFRSEGLTQKSLDRDLNNFPLGYFDPYREGLYKQLSWAANELNRGFYLWSDASLAVWTLADGEVLRIHPEINAGTAGIQYLMSLLFGLEDWNFAVSENGFLSTYAKLFGYPFNYAYEPLLPSELSQPVLSLPFRIGDIWNFTSGPHGGWNDGSAWAALDFAPPGEDLGCFPSKVPVVASADGLIVRSGNGAVVQDLDGDGVEQTNWSILYMHIATEGRVAVGEYVHTGDIIGYASCEGGFSSGTHLHIARRYNGVWIAADSKCPFVMDGWVPVSIGIEYDGFLENENLTIEAWNGRTIYNQISR